jgi:nitrogen regulatory protein PII
MKKVETVINECAFQAIRDLLMAQGHDILVSEVRAEQGGGRTLHHRGVVYNGCETRLRIETVVPDSDAMPVVQAILSATRRLDSKDHKVAVSHVETVQSIAITKLESPTGSVTPAIVKSAGAPLPKLSQYTRAL